MAWNGAVIHRCMTPSRSERGASAATRARNHPSDMVPSLAFEFKFSCCGTKDKRQPYFIAARASSVASLESSKNTNPLSGRIRNEGLLLHVRSPIHSYVVLVVHRIERKLAWNSRIIPRARDGARPARKGSRLIPSAPRGRL
jgi:hypothetical protein